LIYYMLYLCVYVWVVYVWVVYVWVVYVWMKKEK